MIPYLLTTAWLQGPTPYPEPQGAVLIRMLPEDHAKLADWADAFRYMYRLFPARKELESTIWNLPMIHIAGHGSNRTYYQYPSAIERRGIYIDPQTPLQLEVGWPNEEGGHDSYESGITARVLLSPAADLWVQKRIQPGICTTERVSERPELFFRFAINNFMVTNSISELTITELFGTAPPPRNFERG